MPSLRVAIVQLEARDDVAANLDHAAALARQAAAGADLVILPEYLQFRGTPEGYRRSAAPIPGPTTAPFQAVARETGAWILAGTHAEESNDPSRPYNTAVLVAPDGTVTAAYRKLHLFDVTVAGIPADGESSFVLPGSEAVVADVAGALVGMSICYDLRFPELYRSLALAGAEVLAVPAVFTARTGRDHWEPLIRARAIENGAWVVAAAGCGAGGPGAIAAWGHSMVVDPWGRVVAAAGDDEAVIRADLDLDLVGRTRSQIPVLANRRPDAIPPERPVRVVRAAG